MVAVTTRGAPQTRALAGRLARQLRPGDVIALVGDLGAGKTTFVQGLATGLGIGAEARVRSPTYTFANVYEGGRLVLYHLDFYRLDDPESALALGVEDYLYSDGVCAVEWADRVPGVLPKGHLRVTLRDGPAPREREIVVEAVGGRELPELGRR